jgi:hypothetical protein
MFCSFLPPLVCRRTAYPSRVPEFTNAFSLRSVLFVCLVLCVVLFCVFTFWVPCCDVRYDFRIKTMFCSFLPPVVCRRAQVLFTLFVLVSNTYCVVFLFCLSWSDAPYVASFPGLSPFWLPLRYSLTFIYVMYMFHVPLKICVVYVFEDCIFYVLGVHFGHTRYYLIDNQASLIVIWPLNWVNKHRWSAECCIQKREIIFTNPSLFVWGTTLLSKYVNAFLKWR